MSLLFLERGHFYITLLKQTPPMNPFRLLLCTFSMLTLASCHTVTFSKKQLNFANQMSAMLNGAHVTLDMTTTSSTSEGNFKKFRIGIEGLPSDSVNADANFLLASSIPAYMFYKDTIEDRKAYKFIDVVVKTDGKEYTNRYTPYQLQQVDDCLNTMDGVVRGLISSNVDSLTYYTDTSLISRSNITFLTGKMKEADTQWGPIRDKNFKGFRFDEKDVKSYILFGIYFIRQSSIQRVTVLIDASTKKVVAYNV